MEKLQTLIAVSSCDQSQRDKIVRSQRSSQSQAWDRRTPLVSHVRNRAWLAMIDQKRADFHAALHVCLGRGSRVSRAAKRGPVTFVTVCLAHVSAGDRVRRRQRSKRTDPRRRRCRWLSWPAVLIPREEVPLMINISPRSRYLCRRRRRCCCCSPAPSEIWSHQVTRADVRDSRWRARRVTPSASSPRSIGIARMATGRRLYSSQINSKCSTLATVNVCFSYLLLPPPPSPSPRYPLPFLVTIRWRNRGRLPTYSRLDPTVSCELLRKKERDEWTNGREKKDVTSHKDQGYPQRLRERNVMLIPFNYISSVTRILNVFVPTIFRIIIYVIFMRLPQFTLLRDRHARRLKMNVYVILYTIWCIAIKLWQMLNFIKWS